MIHHLICFLCPDSSVSYVLTHHTPSDTTEDPRKQAVLEDALEAGVAMKVVQDRLNHARESITADIYTHVQAPLQAGAAQRVIDLILPGAPHDRDDGCRS